MLLRSWNANHVRRVVPGWFGCEIGNVFYKRIVCGLMTLPRAKAGVEEILGQVVMLDVEPALTLRALELADELNRPVSSMPIT